MAKVVFSFHCDYLFLGMRPKREQQYNANAEKICDIMAVSVKKMCTNSRTLEHVRVYE